MNLIEWADSLRRMSMKQLEAEAQRLHREKLEIEEKARGEEEQRRWDEGDYVYPW